jgi:hypothetical protein
MCTKETDMEGSVIRKLCRIQADLLLNPLCIPRYLRDFNKSPLELEIPWCSYKAIDILTDLLKPDMRVFEYGAGGSTLFFMRRVRQLTSIEPHPAWYENVRRAVGDNANVDLRRSGEVDKPQDVIFIDHDEPPWNSLGTRSRVETFRLAEPFVKPGGIIVLDDSWRHPELRQGRRVMVCKGVGPCRPGVTSTDIFFY